MKAVGFTASLPISDTNSLQDVVLANPVATGRDLLVEVRAISVNPVDTKVRKNTNPAPGETRVLGWDAAGVVRAVGSGVSLFKPNDRVWYAGSLPRPGANSELHLVDERLVGLKPESLDYAHAAALPLTTITAWEVLFDRLQIPRGRNTKDGPRSGVLLIIGAGGGVGSIMVQLARQLTDLTVVATASRPETQEWVLKLGAHHAIDHSKPLSDEFARIGLSSARYVASLTHTHQHFAEIVKVVEPQGRVALIDDPELFDFRLLKRKSVSLHWESMFTRSVFNTPDMELQHEILSEAAQLVDAGVLKTTFGEHYGAITATNLRRAHAVMEAGTAKGKIVLEGF